MDSKTIELVSGYDRSKKPTKQTFRIVTLEEVKSWAVPQESPCPCSGGYRAVTVQDEDHASLLTAYAVAPFTHRALDREYIQVKSEVLIPCSCRVMGHVGIQTWDITPGHVWFVSIQGTARQAKVNGKVRTWKRDANRVELPIKYGMYEYATITQDDINNGRLIMPM